MKFRIGAQLFLKKTLFGLASLAFLMPPVFSQATSEEYLKAGTSLYAAKDYGKAIQYYQAALKVNPDNAEAYQGLGNCYFAQGLKPEALAAYHHALQLNPTNTLLADFVQNIRGKDTENTPTATPSPVPLVEDSSILRFTTDVVPVVYDHNHTKEEIKALSESVMPSPAWHVNGLTHYHLAYACDANLEVRIEGGIYQAWVKRLDIRFYIDEFTVYVSSKYPEGSCPYGVILAHENKHVAIASRAFLKYEKIMEREIRAELILPTPESPITARSVAEVRNSINSRVRSKIDAILKRCEKEMRAEHAKIDTLKQYKKSSLACKDW